MIPSLLGEPYRDDAIIVDTFIRGSLELIPISMPIGFLVHDRYTSFRFPKEFFAPLDWLVFRFLWQDLETSHCVQGLLGLVLDLGIASLLNLS